MKNKQVVKFWISMRAINQALELGYVVVKMFTGEIFYFNFKLYLFYNNNTWLQIDHNVIFLGGFETFFGLGKPLEFLPQIKNPNLLMPAVEFEPMTSQSLSGGVNTSVSSPP